MIWLCWFFHRWNKWSDPFEEIIMNDPIKTDIQERRCSRCNLNEWRRS